MSDKKQRARDAQPDKARFLSLIDGFARRRVVVVGDIIADEFIYGQISRVSREAPVLILKYDHTQIVAGGAGNAANNVAALGGQVSLVGAAGRDEAGRRLIASFHPRVSPRGILRLAGYTTPVKTRVLAGDIHSAKQQVVRVDRQTRLPDAAIWRSSLVDRLETALAKADAVLISDYGFGMVDPLLIARAAARARRNGRRVPMLVDSRYGLGAYHELTACTPNQSEVEELLGVSIADDSGALERAGRTLLRRTRMEAVLVTRGSRGMALFLPGTPTTHIPIFGSTDIADVTGAGDTVIATMTLALAAGASFYEAARLANYAGGIVVMKRGTATVNPAELRHAVGKDLA